VTGFAALPMYDLREVRGATDALWRGLARHLRAAGIPDVPEALDRARPHEEQWSDPRLLFGQTCGYPLVRSLRGKVRVVATPCHDVPGCESGAYASVVVVAEASQTRTLDDLRGAAFAMNDRGSHSGANAIAALIAPLATPGAPFFSSVRLTGDHVASIAAVAAGEADVASIDGVTHALLTQHRPRALDGTRVLCATASAPAPPYVTSARTTDDDLARIRDALAAAMADPALASARAELLLRGVRVLPEASYERIAELEALHADKDVLPAGRFRS
jgi:ABC-type phosphate/phosphonate transport system substrate-binding protein